MRDGRMWERVSGPDLCPGNRKRYKENTQVMESGVFVTACTRVKIPPTRKQASKFRRKKGLAWKEGRK